MIKINCYVRCLNGIAPSEDTVDIMERQLAAYAEVKYPTLKIISNYQYWTRIACTDDWSFFIFKEIKEMKDDSLSDVQQLAQDGMRVSVGKPDVIKAALAANKQQLNSWIREKENVYATELWNEAIEAAAIAITNINVHGIDIPHQIRKLKK